MNTSKDRSPWSPSDWSGWEEEDPGSSKLVSSYNPFKTLPIDLLRPIFANLRLEELLAVSFTCKSFYQAAIPLIYEKFKSHVWPHLLKGFKLSPSRQTAYQGGPWSPPAFQGNWSPWGSTPVRDPSIVSYREKHLWDMVIDTYKSKMVKHVQFLIGDEDSVDVSQARRFTQRLFANLSPEMVNSIDTTALCLPDIRAFHKLTKLTVQLFSTKREYIELPALPNLQSLCLYWNVPRIQLLPWNCAFVFATFCGLVLTAPTIRHLTFKSIYEVVDLNTIRGLPAQDTDRILRCIHLKIDLVKLFETFHLPNLKSFILEQETLFLKELFPIEITEDSETSVTIFSVLRRFLLRHRHQLTNVRWNAVDSIVDSLVQGPLQIPLFPNALRLSLQQPEHVGGNILNTKFQEYLKGTIYSAKGLKKFRLNNLMFGPGVFTWARTGELSGFKNLTFLTIELGLVDGFEISRQTSVFNQMLGCSIVEDTKGLLPNCLKKLDIRILRSKDSTC
ncbi:hypothetical protein TWF694_002151 [Orbilia ellipsospora]|uniref:F-box domain-containing protein n=1 Tax=Orbilia ellipsospora TaxID=2528407 RepID=A0AAV9X7A4_9PEZI